MSTLDRYRKAGGFVQLLNLIETSGPAKAEKFLKLIAEESPVWEAEIRKKALSIDRLLTWNQTYLMEVFPRIPSNIVATAIAPLPPEKQQIILGSLGFSDRRRVEDTLRDTKPNPGEIASCQTKVLNEIRTMVASGHLKFEKADPELVIPENIEEMLNSGGVLTPLTPMPGEIPAAAGSAPSTGGAGVPSPSEELLQLRRRVMALTQENQLLKQQLQTMKDKLDQIRKAAA